MKGNIIAKALFFMLIISLPFSNIELLGFNLYDWFALFLGFVLITEILLNKRTDIGLLRYSFLIFVVLIFDLLGVLFSINLYDIDVHFMILQHGRLFLGVLIMLTAYRYIGRDPNFYLLLRNALFLISAVIVSIWLLSISNILNIPSIFKLGNRLAIGFQDPNYFGGFLLLPLSFMLGNIFMNSNQFWKFANLLMAIVLSIMIVATLSRGAIISCVFPWSLVIFLWLRQGLTHIILKLFTLIFATTIVVIGLSLILQMQQLLVMVTQRFDYERIVFQIDQNRQTIWSYASRFIVSHPWGAGYGNFRQINPTGLTAHNLFFESLTEFGLIGGMVFLTFVVWLFIKLIKRGITNGPDVAVVGAVGSTLLHSLTLSELFNRTFWLVLGIGLGYLALARRWQPK